MECTVHLHMAGMRIWMGFHAGMDESVGKLQGGRKAGINEHPCCASVVIGAPLQPGGQTGLVWLTTGECLVGNTADLLCQRSGARLFPPKRSNWISTLSLVNLQVQQLGHADYLQDPVCVAECSPGLTHSSAIETWPAKVVMSQRRGPGHTCAAR